MPYRWLFPLILVAAFAAAPVQAGAAARVSSPGLSAGETAPLTVEVTTECESGTQTLIVSVLTAVSVTSPTSAEGSVAVDTSSPSTQALILTPTAPTGPGSVLALTAEATPEADLAAGVSLPLPTIEVCADGSSVSYSEGAAVPRLTIESGGPPRIATFEEPPSEPAPTQGNGSPWALVAWLGAGLLAGGGLLAAWVAFARWREA